MTTQPRPFPSPAVAPPAPFLDPGGARIRDRMFWPLLVIVVTLPMWAAPLRFVFTDDGLFTLQIAYHIVAHGRATFNGVMPTNGYQPLWMPFNVLAMWLARANRTHALPIMMAIEVLLLTAALSCYRGLTIRLGIGRSWLGSLVLLSLAVFRFYGLETFLAILLIIASAGRYVRAAQTDSVRQWCGFGILAGLLTLARLDDVLLPAVLIARAVGARGARRAVARRLCAGLPILALAGPYLIYNRINYGYYGPISEATKNSFPRVIASFGALGPVGLAVGIAALAGLAASFTIAGPAAARPLVRNMSLAALAQVAGIFLFSFGVNSQYGYYYTIGIVALALGLDFAAAGACDALRNRNPALARYLAVSGLAVVLSLLLLRSWTRAMGYAVGFPRGGVSVARGNAVDCAIKLAVWMNRNLPPGSRMLVIDYPGILAYRSDLAIVPLDGVMSDYHYSDYLLKYGIDAFIKANRITYYAGVDHDAPGLVGTAAAGPCVRIAVQAPLFHKPGGSFLISRPAKVIDVPRLCASRPEHTPFDAIWRLGTAPRDCGE